MPIDTPDAMRFCVPPSTDEVVRRRAGIQIPHRHLDAGLGHVVAAHALQRRKDLARVLEALADHERRQETGNDVPHGFGRFAAVVGIGFGDRFGPSLVSIALNPDQDERAVVGTAETRLEKMDERQAAQEELDTIDLQTGI